MGKKIKMFLVFSYKDFQILGTLQNWEGPFIAN